MRDRDIFRRVKSLPVVTGLVIACLIPAACGESKPPQEPPAVTSIRTSTQEETPPDFEKADRDTVRLSPDAFSDLPSSIRADLKRRGCTIPQEWFSPTQNNVVKGHFSSSAQIDIAVLCSVSRISSILVFRNSSASDVAELASARDANYLQTVLPGKIGYSRGLGVVGAEGIQKYFEKFGGPTPPPIDHEGINDMFIEKASVVRYWHEGKWLELTGAD
jgi:hypothetical protein